MSTVEAAVRRPTPGARSAEPTIAGLGTILGVWAHPDDEAYLSAGLMAVARRVGNRVAVRTATAGEHGTPDPRRWPPARLGPHRRRELAASLAHLGVDDHAVASFRDGACASVPHVTGQRAVARWIDEIRPATIVTFGPDGMTGHPDHRAVSAWATAAWEAAGRPCRLLYATVTPEFHDRWDADNERIGLWSEGERPCTDSRDLALEVRCDGALLDTKARALAAHASQVVPLRSALGAGRWRSWWAVESFVDAEHVMGDGEPAPW